VSAAERGGSRPYAGVSTANPAVHQKKKKTPGAVAVKPIQGVVYDMSANGWSPRRPSAILLLPGSRSWALPPKEPFTRTASTPKNKPPDAWPAGRNAQAQSANGAHGAELLRAQGGNRGRRAMTSASTAYKRLILPRGGGAQPARWKILAELRAIEQGDSCRGSRSWRGCPDEPSHLPLSGPGQETNQQDRLRRITSSSFQAARSSGPRRFLARW